MRARQPRGDGGSRCVEEAVTHPRACIGGAAVGLAVMLEVVRDTPTVIETRIARIDQPASIRGTEGCVAGRSTEMATSRYDDGISYRSRADRRAGPKADITCGLKLHMSRPLNSCRGPQLKGARGALSSKRHISIAT